MLDLIKWHQALESGQLLSSASYEAMYQPTKLPDGKTRPYGYGWGVGELAGHRKLSHGGGINGFSTMIARYPDDRLAVIVLSNTITADSGGVENKIAKLLLNVQEKPIEDLPTANELLEQLTGKYRLEEGQVEVTSSNGQLFAKLGDQPQDRLKYQGDRVFVPAKNPGMRVTFTPKDGRAAGFEVEVDGQELSAKRVE